MSRSSKELEDALKKLPPGTYHFTVPEKSPPWLKGGGSGGDTSLFAGEGRSLAAMLVGAVVGGLAGGLLGILIGLVAGLVISKILPFIGTICAVIFWLFVAWVVGVIGYFAIAVVWAVWDLASK